MSGSRMLKGRKLSVGSGQQLANFREQRGTVRTKFCQRGAWNKIHQPHQVFIDGRDLDSIGCGYDSGRSLEMSHRSILQIKNFASFVAVRDFQNELSLIVISK